MQAELLESAIRAAEEANAAVIAAIYATYLRDTIISFEIELLIAIIDAVDCQTFATHSSLIVDNGGEVTGYAYPAKHCEQTTYRQAAADDRSQCT